MPDSTKGRDQTKSYPLALEVEGQLKTGNCTLVNTVYAMETVSEIRSLCQPALWGRAAE